MSDGVYCTCFLPVHTFLFSGHPIVESVTELTTKATFGLEALDGELADRCNELGGEHPADEPGRESISQRSQSLGESESEAIASRLEAIAIRSDESRGVGWCKRMWIRSV